VVDQVLLALDPAISEFADLLRVEAFPLLAIELFKKFQDKN